MSRDIHCISKTRNLLEFGYFKNHGITYKRLATKRLRIIFPKYKQSLPWTVGPSFNISCEFGAFDLPDQGSYKKLQPFFKDFSRTTLSFQGPLTRNIISQIVEKCTFPVHPNDFKGLNCFASLVLN